MHPAGDDQEDGCLMRSLLFVPGDSEKKLEKGFSAGADVVIVDLEDSVAPENKPLARRIAPNPSPRVLPAARRSMSASTISRPA